MLIIDRNDDYYDHFSKVYGVDDKVVFDRRGSSLTVDWEALVTKSGYRERGWESELTFLCLEVGFKQHIIKVSNFVEEWVKGQGYKALVSADFDIVHTYDAHKNLFGKPLSLQGVKFDYYKFGRAYDLRRKVEDSISSVLQQNAFHEVFEPIGGVCEPIVPILRESPLKGLLNPQELWIDISTYISSLGNEKTVDTMTDIDKVVSHGFDKKESFRGKVK